MHITNDVYRTIINVNDLDGIINNGTHIIIHRDTMEGSIINQVTLDSHCN